MPERFIVHHIFADETRPLVQTLFLQLQIDESVSSQLLTHGAIWSNFARTRQNITVEKGHYIRVHLQPRRFPTDRIDWSRTILHDDPDFFVVHKPSGIPVHATVDNWVENVIYCLERHVSQPLFITQRLDVVTEGVLLVAKTKWFQSQFNKLLRERQVQKLYLSLTEKQLPLGEHVHHLIDAPHAPKHVIAIPNENTQECRLIVHGSKQTQLGFESQIELLTGRTHQIRAQLVALGTPIMGDSIYGSTIASPWAPQRYAAPESIALCANRLQFTHPSHGAICTFECKPSLGVFAFAPSNV